MTKKTVELTELEFNGLYERIRRDIDLLFCGGPARRSGPFSCVRRSDEERTSYWYDPSIRRYIIEVDR